MSMGTFLKKFIPLVLSSLFAFFSSLGAQENTLRTVLQNSYDLSSKFHVVEKDFYGMRTVYLDMNDSGRVAQTRIVEGCFEREITESKEGRWTADYVWKYAKIGQIQGKGEVKDYRVLPYAQLFQYIFCPRDWTPSHFPVELSAVPKTLEGWDFVVNLIDTHTFDKIIEWDSYEDRLERIGQTIPLPTDSVPVSMDFPPLFTDTYFVNAPFFTTFQGLTWYQEEACALLTFHSDDSYVRMVVNMMDMKLPTDGVSYYWGDIILSLRTGKILKGRIFERVDSITTLVQFGKPMRHVTRREITLERISEEAYDTF